MDSQEHENVPQSITRRDGGIAITSDGSTSGHGKWEVIDTALITKPSASRKLQIFRDIDPAGLHKVPLVNTNAAPQHDLLRPPARQASVSRVASVVINAILDGFYDAEFQRLEQMLVCAEFQRLNRMRMCEEVPIPDQVRILSQIDTPAGTSMIYTPTCASVDAPKPDISPAAPNYIPSPRVAVAGLEIIYNRPQKPSAAEKDGEVANVDQTTPAQIKDSESLEQGSSSADGD